MIISFRCVQKYAHVIHGSRFMKQFVLFVLMTSIAAMGFACSDEGYIKVFKCNPAYPYFNVVDNHCYTSEEAAAAANDKASANPGDQEAGDQTDQGKEDAGQTDQTDQGKEDSGQTDKADQGDQTDQGKEDAGQTDKADQGDQTDQGKEDAGE